MKRSKWYRLLLLLTLVALVAAACGGDGDDGGDDVSTGDDNGETKKLADGPGFSLSGRTIKLGMITPLTGPVAVIGKPLTAGHEVYWKYVNDELGGIDGKYKVELATEDSQYNATLALQAYDKIKNDVVLFSQLLGTPSTNTVLPKLRTDNVVAAPASLDAEWVRQPNLLPIGGPYQIQMINGASYFIEELDGKDKTICSMIQDDPYGESGQQGIDFAAEELDFEVKTTAKFKTGDQDFTGQISQLKSNGCEAVFIVSVVSDMGKIFGAASQAQFTPTWFGQSPSWIGALAASPLKDYFAKYFYLVSEGTEWGDTSVPGMTDMIARLQKYQPSQPPDYYFGFGYNQARAVHQVLEKAVELGDLSRAGIKKAMEEVGTLKFDGLTGDYKYGKADDREPPRASSIFKINPAKPIGIEKVELNFTSDAAKKFKI